VKLQNISVYESHTHKQLEECMEGDMRLLEPRLIKKTFFTNQDRRECISIKTHFIAKWAQVEHWVSPVMQQFDDMTIGVWKVRGQNDSATRKTTASPGQWPAS